MNSLFATCSDPTTLARPGSAAVQRTIPTGPAAIHANPALPANDLILAVHCGSTDALRNPSLPLVLINGGTYEVDGIGDMDDGKTTPTVAVERCMWLHIAGAVSVRAALVPRRPARVGVRCRPRC